VPPLVRLRQQLSATVPLSPFGLLAVHMKIALPGGCEITSLQRVTVTVGLPPLSAPPAPTHWTPPPAFRFSNRHLSRHVLRLKDIPALQREQNDRMRSTATSGEPLGPRCIGFYGWWTLRRTVAGA
jgi:hypothetical protein